MNKKTQLMGVVNVTTDSFYDGGRHLDAESAVRHALKLEADGADILDIGGESTWITSTPVELEEELRRTIPVIRELKARSSLPLSIDTTKPEVAKAAVEAGASFINDISGFRSAEMRRVAAETGATLCVVHMLGTPKTMQINPSYPRGVVETITLWFEEQVELLTRDGVEKEKIILDPGIGFGKTIAHNYEILLNLGKFRSIGFPILLGTSRKSFIYKVLGLPPDSKEVLAASTILNTLMMQSGVEILRVHDVAEHRNALELLEPIELSV